VVGLTCHFTDCLRGPVEAPARRDAESAARCPVWPALGKVPRCAGGDDRDGAAYSEVVAEADLKVRGQGLRQLKDLGTVDDDAAEVPHPAYR
jgi:hypothetical protein